MKLLEKDQKWLDFHKLLATTKDYDLFSFSQLLLEDETTKKIEAFYEHEESARFTYERKELLRYCRPATISEFNQWILGHLRRKLKDPNKEFRYVFNQSELINFYMLVSNPAYIPELYGSDSINLIIPTHLNPRIKNKFHGKCGHNTLLFMENYTYL